MSQFRDRARLIPTDFSRPQNGSSSYSTLMHQLRNMDKKWQRRLYWIVPLAILAIVFAILFTVYKSDFERWVSPLTNWLHERESWSWVLPVIILFLLSFPPLAGHEIVQLVVGLTYPLGIAIGIACAGSVLGEAGCFIAFKYGFTGYVEKKIAAKVRWAAIARVTQEVGFRGVLLIRYSIVPPHLANPLFACTGMKFWVYMTTVFLSLPKSIIFVALGAPTNTHAKAAKYVKVLAVIIIIVITVYASKWMYAKITLATKEIEAERVGTLNDQNDELDAWSDHAADANDTAYHGHDLEPGNPTVSYHAQDVGEYHHDETEVEADNTRYQSGDTEYHGV